MTSFTLDTNCLIDVEDERPAKPHVLLLLEAAQAGQADVAMVASSASERQPGGLTLATFGEFTQRMQDIGMAHIRLLRPIGRYDLSYWDFCIYPTEEQSAREQLIFRTLFPNTPVDWPAYAADQGIDPEDLASPAAWNWRNKLCDVQAFWAHDDQRRDVFVTSDKNFNRRLLRCPEFQHAGIAAPAEALNFL